MNKKGRIAILHYTASPVVGGVEAVIDAHCQCLVDNDYQVTVIAGRGDETSLPQGTCFNHFSLMDTQHPDILAASALLETGVIPTDFEILITAIENGLLPLLKEHDHIIVHNIFTKHFNLPLTAALERMIEKEAIGHLISWCHDLTWTSENSRHKVHAGYPWDLLKTRIPSMDYVTISQARAEELGGLFGCPAGEVEVIENGVNPQQILGLPDTALRLIERMKLLDQDLVLLMPVRVTSAKNIEFALQVTAELVKTLPKTKLVITGPPDPHDARSMDYYQTLLDLRKDLGVQAQVCFVFESGVEAGMPNLIDIETVFALYRVSDILLLPSHREGFGMSILEAGLMGMPVYASLNVPSALELGGSEVNLIGKNDTPREIAEQILVLAGSNPQLALRRRVRKQYTWGAIFKQKIEPLLKSGN